MEFCNDDFTFMHPLSMLSKNEQWILLTARWQPIQQRRNYLQKYIDVVRSQLP
jgi:hypothetical protein